MKIIMTAVLLTCVFAGSAQAQYSLLATIDSASVKTAEFLFTYDSDLGTELFDYDGDGGAEIVILEVPSPSFSGAFLVFDESSPLAPVWTHTPDNAVLCPSCVGGDRFEYVFIGFTPCGSDRLLVYRWVWDDFSVPSQEVGIAVVSTTTDQTIQMIPDHREGDLLDVTGDGVPELVTEGDLELKIWGNCAQPVSVPMLPDSQGGPRLRLGAPNPTQGLASVMVDLDEAQSATLVVFDVAGRKVRTIHRGNLNPGHHAFQWDGTDEAGRRVGAGTYFYRLSGRGFQKSERMVLLR